jgi:hypothetical protein
VKTSKKGMDLRSAKSSGKLHWDTVTAACSVVIAVCALVVTSWQTAVTREHNRLSVLPSLNIYYRDESEDGEIGWVVENTGLGPAIIGKSVIWVDDAPIEGGISYKAWVEAVKQIGIPRKDVVVSGLAYKEVVQHGSQFPLLALKDDMENEQNRKQYISALWSRVHLEVCFCSFYGECWLDIGGEGLGTLECQESVRLDQIN